MAGVEFVGLIVAVTRGTVHPVRKVPSERKMMKCMEHRRLFLTMTRMLL